MATQTLITLTTIYPRAKSEELEATEFAEALAASLPAYLTLTNMYKIHIPNKPEDDYSTSYRVTLDFNKVSPEDTVDIHNIIHQMEKALDWNPMDYHWDMIMLLPLPGYIPDCAPIYILDFTFEG